MENKQSSQDIVMALDAITRALLALNLPQHNPYKFSVYRAAAHTSSSSPTKVDHDTTEYDDNADVTGNDRFVCEVAGTYTFRAVAGNTAAGSTPIYSYLYKNGSRVAIGSGHSAATSGSYSVVIKTVKMAVGDYMEHWFVGGNGSVMGVGSDICYFQGEMISKS